MPISKNIAPRKVAKGGFDAILRWIYWGLFWCLAVMTLAGSVLSFVGFGEGWLPELSSHFRVVYLWLNMGFLLYVLLGAGFFQMGRFALILLIGLNLPLIWLNASTMAVYYQPRTAVSESHILRKIKILHVNVLGVNQNPEPVIHLIRNTRPDILTLAEYNPRWQRQLEQSGVLRQFVSSYVVKFGNDGIYSTIPFERKAVKVDYVKPGQDSTVRVHLIIENVPVSLLVIHPRPPVKPKWYERHKNHFAYLEHHWEPLGDPTLLIGDLNTSPWSYTFRHFMSVTGLQDSQAGWGVQPSWPVLIPERGIENLIPLIPIDHILHSQRFAILSRRTGPQVGSDHLPVIAEVALLKK